jgi:hypothetical protein
VIIDQGIRGHYWETPRTETNRRMAFDGEEKKLKISSLTEDKGSPIVEQSRAWMMESTSGKSGSVSDGS